MAFSISSCKKNEQALPVVKTSNSPSAKALLQEQGFIISTHAGYLDGALREAQFWAPQKLDVDKNGVIYIIDGFNNRIRKIAHDTVSTFAGNSIRGYKDGKSAIAQFSLLSDIAVGKDGYVYVADGKRIRRICSDGEVSTFAGTGENGQIDGPASKATFIRPTALVFGVDGALYVADSTAIRKIYKGTVSTIYQGSEDQIADLAIAKDESIHCLYDYGLLRQIYGGKVIHETDLGGLLHHPSLVIAEDGAMYYIEADHIPSNIVKYNPSTGTKQIIWPDNQFFLAGLATHSSFIYSAGYVSGYMSDKGYSEIMMLQQ